RGLLENHAEDLPLEDALALPGLPPRFERGGEVEDSVDIRRAQLADAQEVAHGFSPDFRDWRRSSIAWTWQPSRRGGRPVSGPGPRLLLRRRPAGWERCNLPARARARGGQRRRAGGEPGG